jgi:hypothetical protein
VGLLLGEQNAINLYEEDASTKAFEEEAKRIDCTVIACDPNAGRETYLEGVIDPLTYAEQEQAQGEHKNFSLHISKACGSGHANTTANGDCLPPMLYLKPGEQVTHMWKKTANPEK